LWEVALSGAMTFRTVTHTDISSTILTKSLAITEGRRKAIC